MIIIPLTQYPWYTEEIEISGTLYVLEFYWNYRGQYWSMNIYNSDGKLCAAGIKIVKNYPLTAFYPTLDLPKGTFVAADERMSTERLTETEFGTTVQLVFVPEEE